MLHYSPTASLAHHHHPHAIPNRLQSGAHGTRASPEVRPPLRPSSQQDNRAPEQRLSSPPSKLAELSAAAYAASAAADEGRRQRPEDAAAAAAEEEDGGDAMAPSASAGTGGASQPPGTQSCDVQAALEALEAVVARACGGGSQAEAEDGEVALLAEDGELMAQEVGGVGGWWCVCGGGGGVQALVFLGRLQPTGRLAQLRPCGTPQPSKRLPPLRCLPSGCRRGGAAGPQAQLLRACCISSRRRACGRSRRRVNASPTATSGPLGSRPATAAHRLCNI